MKFSLKPKTDAGLLVSIILLGIYLLLWLAFWAAVIYIGWHFVKKLW